jgi:P-type E1-E2 ATPase
MYGVDIPGFGNLRLEHLLLDFNGTLAVDGRLLGGVSPLLIELSAMLHIHVLTADTFGSAANELAGLPVHLSVMPDIKQAEAKLEVVQRLQASQVVAIGNGRNDRLMLQSAALGIAVTQAEGAAGETLAIADIVAPGIVDALELLRQPRRLIATLRV